MIQPSRLTCTVRGSRGGVHRVALTGELDQDSAPAVRSTLDAIVLVPHGGLILDLSELAFCDSSGITALLHAYDRAASAGVTPVIAGLAENVSRLFDLTGLSQVFTVYPTADDAATALATTL